METFVRIVIIGGGFTGAAVAMNLLKILPREAGSITVIEPREALGAGLAYSSADDAHRVNVPASRLLVLPDEPGAFQADLKTSGALTADRDALDKNGHIYPRRHVFGRYIAERLCALLDETPVPPFRHLRAEAGKIIRNGRVYEIFTDTGEILAADVLVLAVSHPPPSVPVSLRAVAGAQKFVANPWAGKIGDIVEKHDRVLLIGTALTSADIIASLEANGHGAGIMAISRRGLVARARGTVPAELLGDFSTDPSRTALQLLRAARAEILRAEACMASWEAVIESLRDQGAAIWAALPPPEKHRFLRHLRTFWDVHRYRLAPQLADILKKKTLNGSLIMRAARVLQASYENSRFHVSMLPRHAESAVAEEFDVIVNCTGPDHGRITQTNPVLASLAQAGLLRPDELGLGIETDELARVIDARGQAVDNIFVAGPLARAAFGELMGLPQVTLHAAFVAKQVKNLLGSCA